MPSEISHPSYLLKDDPLFLYTLPLTTDAQQIMNIYHVLLLKYPKNNQLLIHQAKFYRKRRFYHDAISVLLTCRPEYGIKGYNEALLTLGTMYMSGEGVGYQNHNQAKLFWEKALNFSLTHDQTEETHSTIQCYLGIVYHYGENGVIRDFKKAYMCFSKAAESGNNKLAVYWMVKMIFNGEGKLLLINCIFFGPFI